ncbi:8624_t:CDS:2 [Paraglomus occultum]|uniref:8624_t:CDS:1 n=1 Tax=Paraglomus occultum TaxID=144539 RepID=A0A9N9FF65_9GLOM|nr:8624_t:CDS:2 [Paraglomus occultum]
MTFTLLSFLSSAFWIPPHHLQHFQQILIGVPRLYHVDWKNDSDTDDGDENWDNVEVVEEGDDDRNGGNGAKRGETRVTETCDGSIVDLRLQLKMTSR